MSERPTIEELRAEMLLRSIERVHAHVNDPRRLEQLHRPQATHPTHAAKGAKHE